MIGNIFRVRSRNTSLKASLALAFAIVPQVSAQEAPAGVDLTAPGPQGNLAGTLIDPDPKAPLLLIVPGSGPTDRDGNNRYGVAGGPYRQLAEGLAQRGIATLRVDKRGMFGSTAAVADGNHVTIADYAADVRTWIDVARKRTGRSCIWLGGHSEGGLVVLAAAQQAEGVCGVVLVAAAGRPLADIMRAQFRANPANGPLLEPLLALVATLESGKRGDTATMSPPLPALFPDAVQDFLIDQFRYDPPRLAASLKVPLLVTQGDRDIQIGVPDAQALAGARPGAKLAIVPGMTHVLRLAASEDRAASIATYGNASLPVAPALVDAIAGFVTEKR